MIIRSWSADDIPAITVLLEQLGYGADHAEVARRLDRIGAMDRAAVVVAERDERVIGLAAMHIITPINRASDVAWITALVVAADARGSGVGRALVREVERRARAAGCERLTVTTHEDRADAHAFYASIGFELTGRRFSMPLTS